MTEGSGRDNDRDAPLEAALKAARGRRRGGNPWAGLAMAGFVFLLIWAGLKLIGA